jgi:hypothetical protein
MFAVSRSRHDDDDRALVLQPARFKDDAESSNPSVGAVGATAPAPDFSPSELTAGMNEQVDDMARLDALISDKDGFLAVRILLSEARMRLMAVQSKVGQSQGDRLDRLKERRRNLRERTMTTLKSAQIDSKIAQLEKESLYSDDDGSGGSAGDGSSSDEEDSKLAPTRTKTGTMTAAMEQQKKAMALLAAKKKEGGSSTIESAPRDVEDDAVDADSRKRVATQLASQLMAGMMGARGALKPVATKDYDDASNSPAPMRRVEPLKVSWLLGCCALLTVLRSRCN